MPSYKKYTNQLKNKIILFFLAFFMSPQFPIYSTNYNITRQALPINYHYETFVMTEKAGNPLAPEIEQLSESLFSHLAQAHLFQAKIVENSEEVRNFAKSMLR